MARKLKVTRTAVAGGVAALGVTALASGLITSPAQATDSSTTPAPNADGQLGPMGDHGRGGPGMDRHRDAAQYGERVSSERTVKQSDGTIVVIRDVKGSVTAVSATSITVATADGKNYTFVVDANTTVDREHAAAAIADVVVGDIAHVSGTVDGGTATATRIHAETEATEAAEQAARDAAPTTDPATPPADGSAPIGPDADGDGPHDGGMGRGHGGGHDGGRGHGMMGDNDGDGPHGGGKGGPGMGGPDHSHGAEMRGQLISEVSVFQQADGTFITVEEFAGVVTASANGSVTIDAADGSSSTYDVSSATINRDRASATAADIAVGDHVRIEGTLSGSSLTVKNVDAISATAWANGPQGPIQNGTTPIPSASSASFNTASVLKTKKTALAVAKAAKYQKA